MIHDPISSSRFSLFLHEILQDKIRSPNGTKPIYFLPLLPLRGLTSPLDECWLETLLVFEFGVVETLELGEPGFTSLPPLDMLFVVPLLSALMLVKLGLSLLEFDTFCWARRSCFLNLALLFWNHTLNWKN